MKKLILAIAATVGMSLPVMAQNGSIGSGDYRFDGSTPVISGLTVNTGSTSNLVAGGQAASAVYDIHGTSQAIGAFGYFTSPVSQTNSFVLTVSPAIKYSGPGSFFGYMIATNNAQTLTFNYVGGTNVVYAQLQSTNFWGCDSIIVTAAQSTNNVAIGTNTTATVYFGSYH